jgi:hypothetical protein
MATVSLDLPANQKPAYLPELIWHDTEDGMVIVSPTAGKVRVLNKVGGTLWTLLDGKHTPEMLVAALGQKYPQVPETQLRQDVSLFLQDLTARGLVSWRS